MAMGTLGTKGYGASVGVDANAASKESIGSSKVGKSELSISRFNAAIRPDGGRDLGAHGLTCVNRMRDRPAAC